MALVSGEHEKTGIVRDAGRQRKGRADLAGTPVCWLLLGAVGPSAPRIEEKSSAE